LYYAKLSWCRTDAGTEEAVWNARVPLSARKLFTQKSYFIFINVMWAENVIILSYYEYFTDQHK